MNNSAIHRIRQVFLQPRADYSPTETARLLGLKRLDVIARIVAREMEAVEQVRYRVPWQAVAQHATERLTVEEIYAALGKDAAGVLPQLLRQAELRVKIPEYQLRLLQRLSARQGQTVDACLADVLHDLAGSTRITHPEIDDEIPGFAEALFFPAEPS